MQQQISDAIEQAILSLFEQQLPAEVSRPDEQFGDFTSNVALRLSKPLGKSPREIADTLVEHLRQDPLIRDATVAGPGFVNITLSDEALLTSLKQVPATPLQGKTVVAEYSDPNPFKPLHVGHLYTSVTGDAIANLLQSAGATVHRVNFGGDVGLHVAKSMWGMLQDLGGELPDKLAAITSDQHAAKLGEWYVAGNKAYETEAKDDIAALNKRVYQLHTDNDHDSAFAQLYWATRQWSYDYFDAFYARIGTSFEKYYPESQTAPVGLKTVQGHPEVFTQSDGATVFDGEAYGLHTRVFINSQGLPTYETKDMGASLMKYDDYHFDQSIIITGNDIIEYMKVVLKATEQIAPHIATATRHLTHGNVKLAGGIKMGSRYGNVVLATDVLDAASAASQELTGKASEVTTLGAVKYAFLKQRMGGDSVYDPAESVSLEGNSGPYLQYAHARACSIIKKAGKTGAMASDLQSGERSLARKLSEYPEVVARATQELMPHHICTYLYELAQTSNRFYEHNRVIGDEREDVRLALVAAYRDTLARGLRVLGITAPEAM